MTLEEIQQDFKVLFLHPRQFGNSMFITPLTAYYDIYNRGCFGKQFGNLGIGKKPTSLAKKHVVLILDLSYIETEDLSMSFNKQIHVVLTTFLKKYAEDLGTPDTNKIIHKDDATLSIMNILVNFQSSL